MVRYFSTSQPVRNRKGRHKIPQSHAASKVASNCEKNSVQKSNLDVRSQYVEAFSWCTGGCAGRLEPGFLQRCCEEGRGASAGSRAASRRSLEGSLRGCQSGGSAVPGATESDPANG